MMSFPCAHSLDRSNGQFFKATEWQWLFFSNDGMAMVFENSHHHHRWFLAGSTIGSNGFSMVFQFWGPMVHNGFWKRAFNNAFFSSQTMKFATKCALMKMSKTEMHCVKNFSVHQSIYHSWQLDTMYLKPENKHGMKTENTQVDINQGTSCSRHSIKRDF